MMRENLLQTVNGTSFQRAHVSSSVSQLKFVFLVCVYSNGVRQSANRKGDQARYLSSILQTWEDSANIDQAGIRIRAIFRLQFVL